MAAMDLVFGAAAESDAGVVVASMRRKSPTLGGMLVVLLAWTGLIAAVVYPLSGLALMALAPVLLRSARGPAECGVA